MLLISRFTGLENHPVYLYNGLMMIAVFFAVRPLASAALFYRLMHSNENMWEKMPVLFVILWVVFAGLVTLNLLWFYKMITGALALLSKDNKATKAK